MNLTEKEKEIIRLLSDGMTRTEIATKTHSSRRVVGYTIDSLCTRIGIPTKNTCLVSWYYKNAQKNVSE